MKDAIDVGPSSPYGSAVGVALTPRFKDAWNRWRETRPVSDFSGTVLVLVAPDGRLAQVRAVHPEDQKGSGFVFLLEELTGNIQVPSPGEKYARVTLEFLFPIDPSHKSPDVNKTAQPTVSAADIEAAGKKAFAKHKSSCDAGDAAVCVDLGVDYQKGIGVDADPSMAATLFEKACTANIADGCAKVGVLYKNGTGVAVDKSKAFSAYKRSCDLDSAWGCTLLGSAYRDGVGTEKNEVLASSLYDRACKDDYTSACHHLGDLYVKGLGVPKDVARGRALMQTACDKQNGEACYSLAYSYRYDEPTDPPKAVSINQHGCELGDTDCCTNLGLAYSDGRGVGIDTIRARILFTNACDAKNARACEMLGALYMRGGIAIPKDANAAAAYYKKSCDLGRTSGCTALATMRSR